MARDRSNQRDGPGRKEDILLKRRKEEEVGEV